jgi:ribose transport system ATP-binding protein
MSRSDDPALEGRGVGTSGQVPEVPTTFPGELYVKEARKTFGVTKALDGCSFSAHFGEIHAIVGGNGCGKSTLAKVLSGVLPLDAGKVSILGHHPTSPSEARNLGVATVFQEVMVADEATVVDNLFVGADGFWAKAMPAREKIRKARELMGELSGEAIDPLTPAGNLPLSIKAWITIGRALLSAPKILILDESSAALDFDSTERLFSKMRELRDQGVAILIVTHRIAELIRISDRATVMRDGRDVGVLEKGEITEQNLLSLMTGRSDAAMASAEVAHRTESREVVLKTRSMSVWPKGDPVDFGLLKGEIVGVTGLDGHGQDEFVRILAGVAHSNGGFPEIKVSGERGYVPVTGLEVANKQGISFVSGDRKREGILPNMSIFENLLLPLYRSNARLPGIRFIDWLGLNDTYDWEVERLAIKTGAKSDLITSLSGGNQQKVIIGRSFALHPKILVLNDPARGVDVDTKRELYKHLREFAGEGNSVVYMSSELEEFIGFCSRVVVFRNGSIFDTFVDDDVEPVGILEGMFGRARGARRNGRGEADRVPEREEISVAGMAGRTAFAQGAARDDTGVLQPLRGADVAHVKIVDFDEEVKEAHKGRDKIKITYFD